MGKKIRFLVFCFLLSMGLDISLYFISDSINHQNNQFTRIFPPHMLHVLGQMNLKLNSFYLAGFTRTRFFLGNVTAPGYLLVLNYTLSDSQQISLKIPRNIKMVRLAIRMQIDSPYVFLMEGVSPKILSGTLSDSILAIYPDQGLYFNAASVISGQSLFLRGYDTKMNQNVLYKVSVRPDKIKPLLDLLEKRGDGFFSLDGNISRDAITRNFSYVYFYRNEFLYFDSNGKSLLKGKTIDTIQTPQIHLSEILSEGAVTFSTPPLTVNKFSCVDSGFLFINSGLRARNEDKSDFDENSVIDIYSLKNGKYLYSFYIPHHHGSKMKSFQIFNHHLFALYDHSLLTFKINF